VRARSGAVVAAVGRRLALVAADRLRRSRGWATGTDRRPGTAAAADAGIRVVPKPPWTSLVIKA
jgi:hypothetical protein